MSALIHEVVITTVNPDGGVHLAPMGVTEDAAGRIVVAPFRPSVTLDNLQRTRRAVVNCTDDVRVFAGCLTGRYDWPLRTLDSGSGYRLCAALSHQVLRMVEFEDEALRPRCLCTVESSAVHAPFRGFNRAQAAVLEAAILVSRLDRLSLEKIDAELEYLRIAIDRTAGESERLAWSWLMERVDRHRCRAAAVKHA